MKSLALLLFLLTGCSAASPSARSNYLIFKPGASQIRFTLARPDKNDKSIMLAAAGTYTSPQNNVEGYVILNGEIIQMKERQGWDGAVIFQNGGIEIIQTDRGQFLTKEKMREIAERGVSLMQAHLLVYNGEPQKFKPQQVYFRRALALMENGESAIIESRALLDLNDFAAGLEELGAQYAVNLDMGAWSEGWYRDSATGTVKILGLPNEATARQSNWIIFSSS